MSLRHNILANYYQHYRRLNRRYKCDFHRAALKMSYDESVKIVKRIDDTSAKMFRAARRLHPAA